MTVTLADVVPAVPFLLHPTPFMTRYVPPANEPLFGYRPYNRGADNAVACETSTIKQIDKRIAIKNTISKRVLL